MTNRAAVVLFDLDGTLLDHDLAEHEAVQGWAEAEGWPWRVGDVDVASFWHQVTEEAFADYGSGKLTFEGQRRVRVRRLLSMVGDDRSSLDDEAMGALFQDFRTRYEASWVAFPDVLRCVEAVSARHRVAVLSNGDLAEKQAKVKAIGLDSFVEITMASSDLGFAKPDRRAFHAAAARLGVVRSDVVHVGDRLDLDVHAANAAGLVGLWLDRKGQGSDGLDVQVVDSLDELPAWLARPKEDGR